MDLTTNDDWTWVGDDYQTAFATTDDPRVVAVIERDDEWGGGCIDGDSYAPAAYIDQQGVASAGSTFRDDASWEIMVAYARARGHYVNWHYARPGRRQLDWSSVLARYMRAFHETDVTEVHSTIEQGLVVTLFNTPTWREYTGAERGVETLETEDWAAALGGDNFGIGYATNVARVMDGEEIDLEDGQWTTDIVCWGLLGEEYAKKEAAEFAYGTPDLDQLLDFDEPGFVEHTDRMAELDIRDAELNDRGL